MIRFFWKKPKKKLTCKEATKLVVPYINKQLNDRQLYGFTEHVKECVECREELETYYIMYKGLLQLEEKEELPMNMIEALNEDLEDSRHHLRYMSLFYVSSEVMKWLVNILCVMLMFEKILEWIMGI